MHNFQITRSRKSSKSPETVPEKETRRTFDLGRERKDNKRQDENVPSQPLKIFFDSGTSNTVSSRFEWTAKDFHRTFHRDTPEKIFERSLEDNGKLRRKKDEKIGKKRDKSLKNSEWFVARHSKLNFKDGGINKRSQKKRDKDFPNLHEITLKGTSKSLENNGKPSLNSLFTLRKEETLKKKGIFLSKPEASKTSFIFDLSLLPATEPSHAKRSSKTEIHLSVTDIKKIQINEILKGHAQKTQTNPPKAVTEDIKEYSFQGVSELLERVQSIHKSKEKKEKKQIKEPKSEPSKEPESPSKRKHSRETKEIEFKKELEEDKKKIANKWIKCPQVNDIERKQKISIHEPTALFFHTEGNTCLEDDDDDADDDDYDDNDEDDKKQVRESEEKSAEKDKEKINKKRKTYTDRLLLSKAMGKKKEERKHKGKKLEDAKQEKLKQEETVQDEKKSKENRNLKKNDSLEKGDKNADHQVVSKKVESFLESKPMEIPKQLNLSDNNEMLMSKDGKTPDGELYIKAKISKSAELRDLVAQAVKEHKIFCIFDSHGYIVRPVREELLNRGWLEVIPDRRLIPRRRPPPMGPTYDRDKAMSERNSNLLEAVLSAKEAFADEIQETVSKSSSLRSSFEKPKLMVSAQTSPTKKLSSESVIEVFSQFRIMPPTSEKKKNNCDIRDFVNKCQALVEKEKEKEKDKSKDKKGVQKNNKAVKKDKNMSFESNTQKQSEVKPPSQESKDRVKNDELIKPPPKNSLLAIVETINENNRTLIQAAAEISNLNSNAKEAIEVLYKGAPLETKDSKDKTTKIQTNTVSNTNSFYSDSEAKTISKIIQSTNARIHFMWLSIKPAIHLKCFNYSPEIVNKFQKTTFCTKIGLWSHLNNIQWYAHEVHFPAKSPRMYNTGEADDLQAFFQDFQLTACIGMLKWLSDTFFDKGMKAVQAKKGKVPLKAFEFAIRQCEKYIRFKDNEDLGVLEEPKALQEDWNTFLQWFYIITNDHGKVQESSSAQLMVVYTKAVETLRLMKRHWPEIDTDGRLNIWIMKPYCASCGRGIFLTNNIYYIGQHSKYIVQKYIEKPLLIYNTKFDIRQWFMITKLTPLEIWMYKECYLRFCTQPFALRNLHESVHLSNNSVQRKYTGSRDPGLPDQNMWDSHTFQLYLKTIGHPNTWQDIIYPGMRDAIVSTMLAAQETFDSPRRNWFEVYGADFMLSSNPKDGPWLIEINENPAMDPSTKVTARLCPQMLRDVIKVVVDKRNNKNANTGQWELVYRQNYTPSFGTVDLDVRGKKIIKVPHTVPVNPPRTSPINMKRNSEDLDTKPLYDIVKSFDSTPSKGNSDSISNDSDRLKDKTGKNFKPKPKIATSKPVDSGNVKESTDKIQKSTQNVEKFQKQNNQKRERNSSVKSLESSEIEGSSRNSREKSTKEQNSSMSVVSLTKTPGNKRERIPSQSRTSKRTNLGKNRDNEEKEEAVNSYFQYSTSETEKKSGSQNLLTLQNEIFKYAKIYKV